MKSERHIPQTETWPRPLWTLACLCIGASFCFFVPGIASGQTWKRHTLDASDATAGKRGADGVRLADANHDGHLDVVTGWEEGGAVTICFNPGPERAAEAWSSVTVGSIPGVEDAVMSDLDGDGALDVISCAEGKLNQVQIHWAPQKKEDYTNPDRWTTSPIRASAGRRWMYALPMDMNDDGRIDLVVGAKNKNAMVGWLENPPETRDTDTWQLHQLAPASWIMSLESIDMNHDGHMDILYSDRRGTEPGIYWLKNPGVTEEPWSRHLLGGLGKEVMFLGTYRHRSSNQLEVICATLEGKAIQLSQQKSGKWITYEHMLPLGLTAGKSAGFADINLDGRLDWVVTTEAQRERDDLNAVAWKENLGDGWKDHPISDLSGRKFDRFEMIDLDGDGDLDLLTCEEVHDLGVFWYENPTRN